MIKEENKDFIVFGSFNMIDTNKIKDYFSKQGITVKVVYPGTKIGVESTANAAWTSYTILLQANKIDSAKKLLKVLGIKQLKRLELPDSMYGSEN